MPPHTTKLTWWTLAILWTVGWTSASSLAQPATERLAPESVRTQTIAPVAEASIPPVLLSKRHEALCKVKVGDAMPAIELPSVQNSEVRRLAELFGKRATVVVFWNHERRMALEQLADMVPDVSQQFGPMGVNVVGIAVKVPQAEAQTIIRHSAAQFEHLLDAEGRAFAQVGSDKLPRTYLLDPQGKILWFDIEYSSATRRELNHALRSIVGEKNASLPPSANPQTAGSTTRK